MFGITKGTPVVAVAEPTYQYKVVAYTTVANYNTGLAAELAGGWHPISTCNLLVAATEQIVVTYRRRTN